MTIPPFFHGQKTTNFSPWMGFLRKQLKKHHSQRFLSPDTAEKLCTVQPKRCTMLNLPLIMLSTIHIYCIHTIDFPIKSPVVGDVFCATFDDTGGCPVRDLKETWHP